MNIIQQLTNQVSNMFAESVGFTIHDLQHATPEQEKFLGRGRRLDHTLKGEELLTGKDDTLRAAKTNSGFCIQYRETLYEHFNRLGRLFEAEPPVLTNMQVGMERGLKMYGMGMQGEHGDVTGEKPGIFDLIARLKYESWEEYRGIKKEFAQKMLIVYASKVLEDEGKADAIINPNRPGPNYYSECKQWNWVDQLVKAHKKHLKDNGLHYVYGVELTDEELEEMKKLNTLTGAQHLAL